MEKNQSGKFSSVYFYNDFTWFTLCLPQRDGIPCPPVKDGKSLNIDLISDWPLHEYIDQIQLPETDLIKN